ncbi:MAG: thermonuclease family protein [Verrucomicrobia bacterium]|nr:thermonuclease family protein [Verrucomicrobiota bacterium]
MGHSIIASCLVILLCGISTVQAATSTISGKVVGVHDGDTLTLLTDRNKEVRVRLEGIDAPEISQAFGKNSKQSLSDLAFGKMVKIVVSTTDDYGRKIGQVYVDKLWVNLEQVTRGMAWQYLQYSNDSRLRQGQSLAKAKHLGLWQDKNPAPPWDYRHRKVKK